MFVRIVASSLLSVLIAQATAFAQQAGSGQATPSMSEDATQALPQEIKQKLASHGFQDVRVIPESFLISAKDKDGKPITMIISPTAMTVLTVEQAAAPAGESNPDDSKK
jgi:hypothetical protein